MLQDLIDALTWQRKPQRRRRQSFDRRDAGQIIELLSPPSPVVCGKCGADCGVPRLQTRRRRVRAILGPAGNLLHLEVDS